MHYNVPNSHTNTWIESRPKALAAAIEAKATECGHNFRRIIKMIKHWNRIHSDYLQSYHIEVLAMRVFTGNLDDTPWQIYQFFEKARPLLTSIIWYDTGIADHYLSATDRAQVLKRFDVAIDSSGLAWHYTYGSKSEHKSAIEVWKQMFGEQFPSYG